jgi:hypothetical protein
MKITRRREVSFPLNLASRAGQKEIRCYSRRSKNMAVEPVTQRRLEGLLLPKDLLQMG